MRNLYNDTFTHSNNSDLLLKFFLFILNPLLGFLYALKKPNSRSSYIVFFLFGLIYSWVMDTHIKEYDFTRIIESFYMQDYSTSEVWNEIINYFNGNSTEKELYRFVLIWFTHLFSDNYHLLFTFAAIPLLFFMLKSLKYITHDKINYSNSFYNLILLLLFIIPFDIFQVSNFRFATGAWVIIYSTIKIFYDKNKNYLLLAFIAPLIHSGFWFYCFILLIFHLVSANTKLLKFFFYISIPFAFIETDLLSLINFSQLSFLPQSLTKWGDGYLTDEMIDKAGMYRSGSGFYWVEIIFSKLVILSYIIGTHLSIKEIEKGTTSEVVRLKKYFLFFIFFFTITNIIQIVPTLGFRYFLIVKVLFILIWFKLFSHKREKYFLYLILFPTSFFLLLENCRYYYDTLTVDFLYMNVFSLIINNMGITNFTI